MAATWFFIHIMKTAGTTLRWTLENAIGDALYPTDPELRPDPYATYCKQRDELQDPALRDKRFIFGHYPFVASAALPFPVKTAVVLRDPVERAVSMLNHRRFHSPNTFGGFSDMDMLDHEEFVLRQVRNYQTKVFAIDDPDISPNDPFEVDEEGFARACERLQSIDFIGLTEKLPATIKLFNGLAGLELPTKRPIYNAGDHDRSPPTDAYLARLTAELRYDIRLYALARSLFRKQVLADKVQRSPVVLSPATA